MDGGSPDGSDLGSPHTFLGLDEVDEGPWDVVILPVPYEMTTSWGEGTEHGPAATIEVSSQVELYDPILDSELPCGLSFHTATSWSSDAGTLLELPTAPFSQQRLSRHARSEILVPSRPNHRAQKQRYRIKCGTGV